MATKTAQGAKQENIIARTMRFCREVKNEGLKVTWPKRDRTVTTAVIVGILVAVTSLFLVSVDWAVSSIVKSLMGLG